MNCERCGREIKAGEEMERFGEVLCDDCCMDAMSPPKACDPWAVYLATRATGDAKGGEHLTELQQRILSLVEESGGIEPEEIIAKLSISVKDLQSEVATLRHMEKIKGAMRGGKRIICPF